MRYDRDYFLIQDRNGPMVTKSAMHRLQFVIIMGLIVILAGIFSGSTANGMMPEWTKPLIGLAAIILIIVVAFRFGPLFMQADKKEEEKDIYDSTDPNTSKAVMGRLAELKYSEPKKRDKFDNYYKIK